MKRDMDLCRRILLAVESSPANTWVERFSFGSEYDATVVAEHVALLDEAGLIDANITRFLGPSPPHFVIKNLTWYGHDFLNTARHESIWAKAKQRLEQAGMDSTDFALLMEVLKDIARQGLGLGD